MLSTAPSDWAVPRNAPREVLLEWVRANAPDLRILRVLLDDGRRACGARFTFRGEEIEVEAIEGDGVADPDDAIVRRCAWVLYQRMGIPTEIDDAHRARTYAQIRDAQLRGDDATVDKLRHEIATANETGGLRTIRVKWER